MSFWHDDWGREKALAHIYPRLFANFNQQDGMIAERGFWEGIFWRWKLE